MVSTQSTAKSLYQDGLCSRVISQTTRKGPVPEKVVPKPRIDQEVDTDPQAEHVEVVPGVVHVRARGLQVEGQIDKYCN